MRSAFILSLVPVAVTLLDKAMSADIALEGFKLHMGHYVVPYIAASVSFLAALSADQNLVITASARVCELALVVLRHYVGFQVLV